MDVYIYAKKEIPMEVVNVRQARENIARLLDAVSAVTEVVITRRGKPVAKIVKIDGSRI
jgi:prevent-host-death family protein